jgi:hypothetical protein
METLYLVLYWLVMASAIIYVGWYLLAIGSAVIVIFNTSKWEVDITDPTKKSKAVVRKIEPFEIMVITKGGKPDFPIIDKNEQRLTVVGLHGDGSGITSEKKGQWKVERLEEKDAQGKDVEYPDVIQSKWGFFSPLFVFRWIVFYFTQRHVVRVWFPCFIWGFYELYSPHIMTFVRARSKKLNKTDSPEGGTNTRPSLVVIDESFDSTMEMVQDKTDHLLYISPIRLISDTIPTRDGFSLRADVTIIIEVDDLFQITSWKDWSPQLRSVVNNSTAKVFRSGGIDEVYATKTGKEDILQETIKDQLTSVGAIVKGKVLIEELGFKFVGITLNDLIPADEDSKKEMERVMAIVPEGRKNAEVAGMMLKKQIEQLKKADAETKNSLASLTAAQKSGGKIDWIISNGGSSKNSETDNAILAFLKRIENKKP